MPYHPTIWRTWHQCCSYACRDRLEHQKGKEVLIREMAASGVAMKAYKVDYYLNKRFYENLDATFLTADWRD
jgi:hypothetical protein